MGAPIRIAKTSSTKEFYRKVAQLLDVPLDSFRLWKFDVVYGSKEEGYSHMLESRRPRYFIPCPEDDAQPVAKVFELKGDNFFYVELGSNVINPEKMTIVRTNLDVYCQETCILVFLKFYNHSRRKITYHGSLVFDLERPLNHYLPIIAEKLNLPPSTELNIHLVSGLPSLADFSSDFRRSRPTSCTISTRAST